MADHEPLITWREEKNAINREKHKLSFELAQNVFKDQWQITEDGGEVDGEKRWNTVGRLPPAGRIPGGVVVLVTHTYEDDDGKEYIHIISARKATPAEVKRYEVQEPVITRRV
jgi:uncharacterized DUF497 family protein